MTDGPDPIGARGWPPLDEVAGIDLYRRNAFRLTGISTQAGDRELRKRTEKLEMLRRLGREPPPDEVAVLPFRPEPGPEEMRAAEQRLRDVERRFVDEFFWFWPAGGDEAMDLLEERDDDGARSAWARASVGGPEAAAALHNLAVLAHARALDLEVEAAQGVLGPRREAERKAFGQEAHERWQEVLASEATWAAVSARATALADPRLGTEAVRRLRERVPVVLRRIHAHLAVRAAERGAAEVAAQHVARLGGQEAELREAMGPLRARIEALVAGARQEAEANPKGGVAPTKRLLVDGKAALAAVDALLPAGHPLRTPLHDDIALAALACQVHYADATKDWKTSVELLGPASALAEGPDARARLADNARIVAENVDYGVCWWCKREPQDEKAAAKVPMYGDVRREPTYNGTRVLWKKLDVAIPRCKRCKSAHAAASNVGSLGAIVGLAGGIWGGIRVESFWAGVGIGLGLIFLFSLWSGSIPKRRGTRALEAGTKDWRGVKDMEEKGWKIGAGPQ